jgi:hypothetical protein
MGDRYWNNPSSPDSSSRHSSEINNETTRQTNLKNNNSVSKQKNNNSIQNRDLQESLIINISKIGWKTHENYSMEQLIELNVAITDYFTLYKYCYDYGLYIEPKTLKKFSLEELIGITQKFEIKILKKSSQHSKRKKIHDVEWPNNVITLKESKRNKIKKQIKKYVTTDIDEIPFRDLKPLEYTIKELKNYENNPQILGLNDAKLLLLNHEIRSYGGDKQHTITEARKHIQCLISKIKIKEKYPMMNLSNDCKEIMKIYDEKIVPKDFPVDVKITQEQVDQWWQEIQDKNDKSGDVLYENNNKDLK